MSVVLDTLCELERQEFAGNGEMSFILPKANVWTIIDKPTIKFP
jgi:hypothetical protein